MRSFNVINYNLRPNKSIQRQLVFESVQILQTQLDLEGLVYVGLGSIWFTDFHMAHKTLRIRDMVSIEADEIGFLRATFNQPFNTIKVKNGHSGQILPVLLDDPKLCNRPWFVWLDYDGALEESVVDDIRVLIERAPRNSLLIVTFNAVGFRLGSLADRPRRLRTLLGSVVPDDLEKDACRDEYLSQTLIRFTTDFMVSTAASIARPGGFVSAFRISYRDSSPMVTLGGVLPAKGAVGTARATVGEREWPGIVGDPIAAPHLTLMEAAVLQAQLPRSRPLTRKAIRRLGFDLEEEQIRSFERYCRHYPAFAQVMP